jgi:hypothetical protein
MNLLDFIFNRNPPVKARVPREPVNYRFRARHDFFSDETRSQYCKDAVYSVRHGNEKLDLLAKQWHAENKIELL